MTMPVGSKQFSPACDRNSEPILSQLKRVFAQYLDASSESRLLEIGSGSGQHAVYFSSRLKQFNLLWQPSDLPQQLPSIRAWMADEPGHQCLEPLAIDLASEVYRENQYQAIFTANTLHIVAWPLVVNLLQMAKGALPPKGLLIIYGPFKYGNDFTSASNREFDLLLKSRDARSGIRDIESVTAAVPEMNLLEDIAMPANNQLLVFQKHC